jgi:hypothetical protein
VLRLSDQYAQALADQRPLVLLRAVHVRRLLERQRSQELHRADDDRHNNNQRAVDDYDDNDSGDNYHYDNGGSDVGANAGTNVRRRLSCCGSNATVCDQDVDFAARDVSGHLL